MNELTIIPALTDGQLQEIADLAEIIWHEHFTPIIGEDQVNYMVDKFQSYHALKEQIASGYEYFQLRSGDELMGYTGIHEEDGKLFLSKLYLKKEARGRHFSTLALEFLKDLGTKRGLSCIWLTCNRHNSNTLAVYDHFGFQTVRTQAADIGNGYVMDDYIMELPLAAGSIL